uniref:Uncharacterized protein n=1 Tax=Arundo donax TaxID=35708 RepID=A0A0A8Y5U8_ARUDO
MRLLEEKKVSVSSSP